MNNTMTTFFGLIASLAASILLALFVAFLAAAAGCISAGALAGGPIGVAACALGTEGTLLVILAVVVAAIGAIAVMILIGVAASCFLSTRRAASGTTGAVAGLVGQPTPVGADARQPGRAWNCDRARQLLSQARAALDAATAAQAARRDAADQARDRLNQALAAEAGAVAAAAAAIFQPWLLAGAAAALLAASALVVNRAGAAAAAEAALVEANAQLLRAIADKAAAEALVLALCGVDPAPAAPGILDGHLGAGAGLVTG